MGLEKYFGFDKAVKDALVESRGIKVVGAKEQKILELERKLETAILTTSEIAAIRKQLIQLRNR